MNCRFIPFPLPIVIKTFLLIIFFSSNIYSQPVTLVDFGSNESGNHFGLSGWDQLLLDDDMSYTADGPGGVTLLTNLDIYSDYMGVRGTPRSFSLGERVVVTWYNTSDETIYFTSRISFTDQDNPSDENPDGHWYTMRSFNDYRVTYQEILPHDTARTVFNITNAGVHKTDSVYSLVNINLSVEWFDSYMKQFLVCDKIKLLNDADIGAPCLPDELTARSISHNEIQLEWNYPCDDLDPVEYIIYSNEEIEGYSRELSFTSYNLNQATEYIFTVTALDAAGNESGHSSPLTVSTTPYDGAAGLIDPSGFEYLGAIALPEDFAYGADGFAYNPNGDGGMASSEAFPGSFFVTDINQPHRAFVGEVSIPPPVISLSKNIEELHTAEVIQEPVNIRPDNVNNWEYVDVWITGLEYVEEENRLYSSWAIYYDVIFDKTASISCVDAADLRGGIKQGAWFLGSSDPSNLPNDPYLNDYLFQVPQTWADENLSGQSLINGRYREGGLSGLGPTLYSTSLAGEADPPNAEAEAEFTTLLQYGPVEESDNYNFPNSINDYNHADWWKGADWISAEDQAAIAIIGNKGLGHNYYGYNGERMRHEWVIADVPYPEFAETDPNGKGWKAYNTVPMIIFFNPADLAGVASGIISYLPQPYAALRLDKNLFFSEEAHISSAAYNSYNNHLYIAEFVHELFGNIIIHTWRINYIPTEVKNVANLPTEFKLEQNYPNPFNPKTVISFQLAAGSHVNLIVYDILGREIENLINKQMPPGNYEVNFDGGRLTSGIYFYRLISGSFVQTRKMLLLK